MKHVSRELLTVDELARRSKRSKGSWRRDIRERRIAVVRLGRNVRIPVEELERLISSGWSEPVRSGNERLA